MCVCVCVCMYNIYSHKEEGNSAICNNMDEPGKHHAKCNILKKRQIL